MRIAATKTVTRRPPTAALVVMGASLLFLTGTARDGSAAETRQMEVERAPLDRGKEVPTSYADIIEKAAPSVVTVSSTRTPPRAPTNPFSQDPFWERFFGNAPEGFEMPTPRRRQGLGSGVILTKDGYILTNNHVVEGAEKIRVVFADGRREYTAKVVGTDPPTDLAVLKVEAKNLPSITVADSDLIRVGDIVLAIGNPFAVGQTVTLGIVSAVSRGGFGIVDYENFIQTDASINPGNSGGALIDAQGRLIGINTAILSRTGGNQGVGFAIPIKMARMIMDRILEGGRVVRGYLGVTIQPLTAELANQFGVKDQNGALVGGVSPETPASRAGLRAGDVIVEFDGEPIRDSRQLRLLVAQTSPDTKVSLKVIREGKPRTVTVTLEELPASETVAESGRSTPGSSALETQHGFQVQSLSSRLRQQFSVPQNIQGVLVAAVEPGSTAERAGLHAGDVIQEVSKTAVNNRNEFLNLLARAKDSILLRVWSQGSSRFLVLESSQREEP